MEPKPFTPEEREKNERFKNGIDDKEFAKLSYEDKRSYLDIYPTIARPITHGQLIELPDDLLNLYVSFGIGLDDEQFAFIKPKKDILKRNDTHEIKILEIIWELVDMLVKRIKKDKKYENVIIYSYHNKTTDTGIGHVNYYGTMMRYMSFYNENIKYAIIRNCRTPIAPLDVLIQKEWIKSGKDYLFMISNNYNFNSEKNEYEQNFIKNEKNGS